MKALLALALLLGACSRHQSASADNSDPRCAAFADRVRECAIDPSVKPPLSDEEKKNIRGIAYAVCTKTTDDEASLHYYGDVDKKIACMTGKDCPGVRSCLTRD